MKFLHPIYGLTNSIECIVEMGASISNRQTTTIKWIIKCRYQRNCGNVGQVGEFLIFDFIIKSHYLISYSEATHGIVVLR